MNEAPSDLHCRRNFEHTARKFHAQDLVPNLRNIHITDVATMATKCSWNPEETTEAAVKEHILQPLFQWDGTGPEPTRASIIKQLMLECVQQYLQDTRSRFNPRLKGATKMTNHKRQQTRESFRKTMRPTTPDNGGSNGEDASSHPWNRNQRTTTNRHPDYRHPQRGQDNMAYYQ